MPTLLYFKSGCSKTVNLTAAAELGLGYAFTDSPWSRSFMPGATPSGQAGVMFADKARLGDGHLPEYEPQRQAWQRMPQRRGRPELWVGFYTDARPTPKDLERPTRPLDCLPTLLCDDNEWLVPIVADFDESAQAYRSAIATYIGCDADGQPCEGRPLRRHAHLWDLVAPLASELFAFAVGQSDAEPTPERMAPAAVELLKTNYVVDLPELAALELLDKLTVKNVIHAASKFHSLLAWMKAAAERDKKKSLVLRPRMAPLPPLGPRASAPLRADLGRPDGLEPGTVTA